MKVKQKIKMHNFWEGNNLNVVDKVGGGWRGKH